MCKAAQINDRDGEASVHFKVAEAIETLLLKSDLGWLNIKEKAGLCGCSFGEEL